MNRDDSFSDKTIILPTPGGRRRQGLPAGEPAALPRPRPQRMDRMGGTDFAASANRLTANALPLLIVVPKLRKIAFHESVKDLQERLVVQIRTFHTKSLQQGYSEEQVRTASYLVCSLIDETVLNTPWGAESFWGHDTLLVKFHREAVGGEEFFPIVERLMRRPAENLDLLEFAYMCLSLGFEGKYRLSAAGNRALEELRLEVYTEIEGLRGDPGLSLSLNWQGLRDLRSPLTRYVPMWVLWAGAGLLLLLVYLGFSYKINRTSDLIYGDWMTIASKQPKPPQPAHVFVPPPAPGLPDFRSLLADEIEKKMVVVLDGPIVRLTSAFDSGSDRIKQEYMPLLVKIARALRGNKFRVEVIGHTDNRPIFTVRFPSNWALSNARASSVARLLDKEGSLGNRITSKGLADREPIAPNDTPAHRALNRRVDIHIG
ncbi:MAG: type IVB secretion system protein IcmH/DotU [Syntrophobacteraceae bacterium]|nr:type IVB secretion system protein IcmH/DotU [Syntrophobacteraceae bacterium]